MNDREILEARLDLCQTGAWKVFHTELDAMAESLEKIYDLETEKDLHFRKGQVSILNMMINLEESTKLAVEQLED